MGDQEVPDPGATVVSLVSGLSLQEAHLLAGRLEAEGIDAEVSEGRTGMDPWTAVGVGVGTAPLILPGNPFGKGTAEVLVLEADLEEARRIAAPLLSD